MSNHAVKWARKIRIGDGTTKCVLIALATYADGNTNQAWPEQKTLAWELELGERTIRKALKTLEDMGLVTRKKRFKRDGKPTSDLITLNIHHRHDMPVAPPAPDAAGEEVTTGTSGHHHRHVVPSPPAPRAAKYPSESPIEPPPKRASAREEKVSIYEFGFGDEQYEVARSMGLSEDQAELRRTSWFANNGDSLDTPSGWRKRWIAWCERYATKHGLKPKANTSTEVIREGVMLNRLTDAEEWEEWEIYEGRKLAAGKNGTRWFASRRPPAKIEAAE